VKNREDQIFFFFTVRVNGQSQWWRSTVKQRWSTVDTLRLTWHRQRRDEAHVRARECTWKHVLAWLENQNLLTGGAGSDPVDSGGNEQILMRSI
jgi:hypothetical protein